MTMQDRMSRAGDYVLGLMDDAERERAERDMEVDGEFRECVLLLAQRFHVFDRDVVPEEVPDRMWREIAMRISEMPQLAATGIVTAPIRTQSPRPAMQRGGGLRSWVARRPAIGGMLAAACLLVACGAGYLLGQTALTAPEPVVVVVLVNDENVPGAIVEAFGNDQVRIVPLADFEVPEGKVLQAWTLYDKAVGPISLGTFERAREIRLKGPDSLPVPVADQIYEITLEDAPGSAAGRPLGPVLVKGMAKRPAA